ncbi:MAG: TRAP transporter small permease [Rhodobacteraceae bacterium]|nr:TRAP transporter small permease [Paracoccaceae bacterium]
MRGVARIVLKGIDGVNWLVGWLLASLLLVMTVLITWQVFARYVMGNSLTFSEEVARFCLVWMTMLGAAYAYRRGSLIAVELLQGMGGPGFRRSLRISIALASALFAWVLLNEGLNITERVVNQTAPSTRVSMAWPYAAMPAGAGLVLLNALANVIESIWPPDDSSAPKNPPLKEGRA